MALQPTGAPPAVPSDDTITFHVDSHPATLFDPFHGRTDIANAVLHHVSDAFAEDPIRVLRAARYAARYEYNPAHTDTTTPVQFTIAPETQTLMTTVAAELNRMSRDRIGDEITKAMTQATDPTRFWDVLKETGALAVLAPHA